MREHPGNVYHRTFKKHGINISEETAQGQFACALTKIRRYYPCFGYHAGITPLQWWEEIIRLYLFSETRDAALISEITKELYDYYSTAEAWQLLESGIVDTLKSLKERDIKLAIISNSDSRIRNILEEFNILPLFDIVMLSAELGVEKCTSNTQMYEKLLERLRESDPTYGTKDVLHIGDCQQHDFDSAKRFGIQCMLLKGVLNSKTRIIGHWRTHGIDSVSEFVNDYLSAIQDRKGNN
ncbi:haloacid dehalogenase-like hydrolase domain-containing protein [Ditylenchus destructor]|uniref:Haloacid dehalogenase-like hydrolase domain-containing protein n=1 Tax=Ditylenchus destructor TaxID=166010 RepID=A0AAD4RA01_9BILA|nr:haloacid dehalogenase-like hydrolase domain-containing protein [Ditylenchus destructor]